MNIHDATEQAYKNGFQRGYAKGRAAALNRAKRERDTERLTPECCKTCTRPCKGDACTKFRECPHWRAWFSPLWRDLQRALQDPNKKEASKQ